jgi:predicted transposase YbfD/YdcC
VQELIRGSGLENKTFTLDGLDCNKRTTQMIIKSKNDYLITVKTNQIKLSNPLKNLAKVEEPISRYQEIDKSHGRQISAKN